MSSRESGQNKIWILPVSGFGARLFLIAIPAKARPPARRNAVDLHEHQQSQGLLSNDAVASRLGEITSYNAAPMSAGQGF